jgi:type I restriction enzyme M protein
MALTYEDIKALNWYIADQVRDKGNGNNNDAMGVAIPILIFKRLLDMRQEYKGFFFNPQHQEQYNVMQLFGNLNQAISNYQSNAPVFSVKPQNLSFYRIQWDDILNFPDNHNSQTPLTYADGYDNTQYFSNSTDKVGFIQEIIDSFATPKINEIFNYLDFQTKINSSNITQILTYQEFVELLKYLKGYDLSISNAPSDVFSEAYMDLLVRFAPQKGSKQGEFFTPNKITKAGIQMLNPQLSVDGVITACDPTSGACTFLTEFAEYIFKKEQEKLGKEKLSDFERKEIAERMQLVIQEKDRVSFAAGESNLLLHGLLDRTEAYHGNTITEYSVKIGAKYEGKCSYVLANPPYGLSDYGQEFAKNCKDNGNELARWGFGVPNATDGEYAFLQTIIGLLSDKGKAIVVLPLGTLFRDSTAAQRQIFVEQKDWVEGIILLPGKLFNTTDIPVCFWIINKDKSEQDKGKVFFINAENDFTKIKNKNDWNIEKAVQNYQERIEEEGYSKYVSIDTIKTNKFDLSVGKYVKKIKAKEIIDINQTLTDIEQTKKDLLFDKQSIDNIFNQIKFIYSA